MREDPRRCWFGAGSSGGLELEFAGFGCSGVFLLDPEDREDSALLSVIATGEEGFPHWELCEREDCETKTLAKYSGRRFDYPAG